MEAYCSCPPFHTSFLPTDTDESGLHGPFYAERISAKHFTPLNASDLPCYLKTIEFADDPADDQEAHDTILGKLQETLAADRKCYVLIHTEETSQHFHDWGSIFFIFREILVPNLATDGLDRFVIGYD